MAKVFPIGMDRVVADEVTRVRPVKRHRAPDGTHHDDLLYESHDLAATQGDHALRLARLYLASARMSGTQSDTSAERDRARAECLVHWAKEATHNTPAAGGRLLNEELALLKAELDAFDLARGAAAHLIFVSSAAAASFARGKDPHDPEVGSAMDSASRRKRLRSTSDAPQAARLLRLNR
jgi:hypothetical protein